MKRAIGGILACVVAAGSVGRSALAQAAGGAGQAAVATVDGKPITAAEFQRPLVEAYGLKILLYQVTLNLAKQQAEKKNVVVTKADIDAEHERTLKTGFQDANKEDYPALLEQLLEKKGVSRAEWDMVIETNAILRKIAEPMLKDRITEENLKDAFNMRYGQTVQVRHIQCAKPQEALQAKMRIAAGEKFEDVVTAMSQNAKTAALKGELPQFSRETQSWGPGYGKVPQGFKDWAFNAKVGELSDPIEAEGFYHVLKLERKMEPKLVKFDDVKEGLRKELQERLVEQGVLALREQLGAMTRQAVKIQDPVMRQQWEAKLAEQAVAAKQMAEERARQDILNKGRPTTLPGGNLPPAPQIKTDTTTQGAPVADTPPAGPSANAPSGERPPASKSAAPAASDTAAR